MDKGFIGSGQVEELLGELRLVKGERVDMLGLQIVLVEGKVRGRVEVVGEVVGRGAVV